MADVTKTIGIDATTLEANAALRSIVRRDTGATSQLRPEVKEQEARLRAQGIAIG